MQFADQRPQFFQTGSNNFGLKGLVVEHGGGFGSNTTTETQLLTGWHLE